MKFRRLEEISRKDLGEQQVSLWVIDGKEIMTISSVGLKPEPRLRVDKEQLLAHGIDLDHFQEVGE